ncbi:MAG TPA: hypothetical protein VMW46_10405 [Candidatus Desulfaltia sp.]|nr:hypothetical protein [Candidatus Desulfaltia sp.]
MAKGVFSGGSVVAGFGRLRVRLTGNRPFWIGAAIFFVVFLITRLPYFLYYLNTVVRLDSSGYFMIVDQMNKGFWPNLSIRTIGYPLFLKVVYLLFSTSSAVAMVQHAITFVSSLFFIRAMARAFPRRPFLPIVVSLGLAGHAAIPWRILSDSSYMTDSLFVSAIVVTLGLLVLGLANRKKSPFVWASLCAAMTVLIRPAGLFLVPVLALVFVFMVRNRFGRGPLIAAVLPCAAVLLSQMVYNALVIRSFTLSGFSEHALISLTSTFLEPDPSYGPTANLAIERCRAVFRERDRRVLQTSWDPLAINRVFKRYYERNRARIAAVFLEEEPREKYNLYIEWRPLWRRMSGDALRKHPGTALKYIYSSLYRVFVLNLWRDTNLYRELRQNCLDNLPRLMMVRKFGKPNSSFSRRFNTRAYASTLTPDGFARSMLPELYGPDGLPRVLGRAPHERGEEQAIPLPERLHRRLISVHSALLDNPGWTLAFLAAWLFSFARVVRTGFRHRGAFTLFVLTSGAFFYGVLVAALAYPYLRYTYGLEFVYYLSPFIWPIALGREDNAVPAA